MCGLPVLIFFYWKSDPTCWHATGTKQSVLEYYLLGGASSYTEEWMRITGSSHTIAKEMFEDLREV